MKFTALALALTLCLPSVVAAQDAPQFQLQGNQLLLPAEVEFAPESDQLLASSQAALTHVAAYLASKSYISTLRIEAHSSNTEDPEMALALTQGQALAVALALVAEGVDCHRLLPVGFGSSKPIADPDLPAGRGANQRLVFINAALRGHAIGGLPLDGNGKTAGDACSP